MSRTMVERMLVILGEMIDHAGLARVEVAAAEILGADHLAGRRLHQGRAAEEDRALARGRSRSRRDIAGT